MALHEKTGYSSIPRPTGNRNPGTLSKGVDGVWIRMRFVTRHGYESGYTAWLKSREHLQNWLEERGIREVDIIDLKIERATSRK